MITLHILNKSPDHPRFILCMNMLAVGDQLLLTENAVLALADSETSLPTTVLALSADMTARGLTQDDLNKYGVGFDDMVTLTAQAVQIISW